MKKVSFDYDGTLTRPAVRKYAKQLIKRGIDVHIVTATVSDIDLLALKLGIPKRKIHYTSLLGKLDYLKTHTFLFHLDDNPALARAINEQTKKTKGILCYSSSWRKECEQVMKGGSKKK